MNRLNTIYCKFKSEKKKFKVDFEQTELSIIDIKKFIIKKKNMDKCPEKFELIFFDEKTGERLKDESMKIEPNRFLLIERVPFYKLNPSFKENLRDPEDLRVFNTDIKKIETILTQINEIVPRKNDPLEKILLKVNKEMVLQHFACKICGKSEEDPMIAECCGETACKNCIISKTKNDIVICPFRCETKLDFSPNLRIKEIKDRLIYLLSNMKNNKIEDSSKPQIDGLQVSNPNLTNNITLNSVNGNIQSNGGYNQNEGQRNNITHTNITAIPSSVSVVQPTNSYADNSISQTNPHYKLYENSRFFIIKSSNPQNVITSQNLNEWATTIQNQKKLNDAFMQNDVILIFSVNKSGCFQGYAAMNSFISDKVSNLWNNDFSVKLGGTFATRWIVTCELPFSYVKNMTNSLNNLEPVIKSRDTQELPKDIGIQLCNSCYDMQDISLKKYAIEIEKVSKIMEENRKLREKIIPKANPNQIRPMMNPHQMMQNPMQQREQYPPGYFNPMQMQMYQNQIPPGFDHYRMGFFPAMRMPFPYGYYEDEDIRSKKRERSRERSKSRKSKSPDSKYSK